MRCGASGASIPSGWVESVESSAEKLQLQDRQRQTHLGFHEDGFGGLLSFLVRLRLGFLWHLHHLFSGDFQNPAVPVASKYSTNFVPRSHEDDLGIPGELLHLRHPFISRKVWFSRVGDRRSWPISTTRCIHAIRQEHPRTRRATCQAHIGGFGCFGWFFRIRSWFVGFICMPIFCNLHHFLGMTISPRLY